MAQSSLQITKRIEYALRAVICLAELPDGHIMSFRDIAARESIPQDFLPKILRALVTHDLIFSIRGARGGYGLAKGPHEITFLEVIEAIDGPIQLNACLDKKSSCDVHEHCSMFAVWQSAQSAMVDVFRDKTIHDVIRPDRVCENLIRFGEHRSKPMPLSRSAEVKANLEQR